jgi:hypothetical protein
MTNDDGVYTGKTIDITPRWQGVLPIMLQVLEDPNFPPEAKDYIRSEIIKLAQFVDRVNDNE